MRFCLYDVQSIHLRYDCCTAVHTTKSVSLVITMQTTFLHVPYICWHYEKEYHVVCISVSCIDPYAGELVFGGINAARYTGGISYVPVIDPLSEQVASVSMPLKAVKYPFSTWQATQQVPVLAGGSQQPGSRRQGGGRPAGADSIPPFVFPSIWNQCSVVFACKTVRSLHCGTSSIWKGGDAGTDRNCG